MAESEPPTPSHDNAQDCLHCAIGDMVEERTTAPGYASGGLILGGNDNNGEPNWPPLLIGGHRSGAAR